MTMTGVRLLVGDHDVEFGVGQGVAEPSRYRDGPGWAGERVREHRGGVDDLDGAAVCAPE